MVQYLFQPEKVLDCRTGIQQIVSNIEVCESVATLLSTTLGPYGLDKLFYGKKLLLSNDGATILENMNFRHPIGKLICQLSKSQDNEVGDGTTSVVLLLSGILNSIKPLVEDNFPIEVIIKSLRDIKTLCISHLETLKIDFTVENIEKLAETCLNSKNIRSDKEHFAKMIIRALSFESDVNVRKIPGGSLSDSGLVEGIAFEKTFTYAGYEQQPKKITNAKICCLNVELEWMRERENAEMRINSVEEYQKTVDAEWKLITDKLDEIIESGANVVLSSQSIGDYATQYFAKKGIFSAGRVKDLDSIVKAFKGKISNSTKFIQLGNCELFEERQMGDTRFNYFESKNAKAHTLIIRGPGMEVLEEVERAVHDAVCVIRTAMKHKNIVRGGGSVEMQLSKICREQAFKTHSQEIFVYKAVSKAFEKIPTQLAANFGLDPIVVVQFLRQAHSENCHFGVGLKGAEDMQSIGVLEPMEVKNNLIKAVFNAAEVILSIDSTIMAKK